MDVHPRTGPRPTSSHAERQLHAALAAAKLPGWRAWHSLRLRNKNVWEGEGDFVIACPSRGFLVLEVKGGQVHLEGGRWFQNNQPMPKAPRDQGLTFMSHLTGLLRKKQVELPPYGVALAFPDCDFSEGPRTGELTGLVLGRRHLDALAEVLPALLEQAAPPHELPSSRRWLEAIHELWGETWVPTVSLADRLEDLDARRAPLDEEQLRFLDMAGEVPRALVDGGAGTGKTIIATELCRRRAREGQRALYLSFTDALAGAVEADFARWSHPGPRPRAAAIRPFAKQLLAASGLPLPAAGADFWKELPLQAACDALPPEAERPDLVVVDEAQDFEPSDWMLVEQLVGPRGLWVFRDRAQAYWSERELPPELARALTPLKLVKQYRCPGPLWDFASHYTSEALAPYPDTLPDGAVLRAVAVRPDALVERVRHELDTLRKQGAAPSDIAILSLSGTTKSALFGLARLGSHSLAHADAPGASGSVVVDTFLRFKGLERPLVIVTELAGKNVTHYATRMHIALTRATVGAVIVAEEEMATKDEGLRWLLKPS